MVFTPCENVTSDGNICANQTVRDNFFALDQNYFQVLFNDTFISKNYQYNKSII